MRASRTSRLKLPVCYAYIYGMAYLLRTGGQGPGNEVGAGLELTET